MKNNNKNMHLFAIAALAATLMAGQVSVSPAYAESTSVQLSSLIPDNVTVEQPMPLSDISLPDSEYGTLSWVDSSSVPSERVQSYDVVFKPYDSSVLSKISGWDGESDAIYSTVPYRRLLPVFQRNLMRGMKILRRIMTKIITIPKQKMTKIRIIMTKTRILPTQMRGRRKIQQRMTRKQHQK